jgi:hypothetical protein
MLCMRNWKKTVLLVIMLAAGLTIFFTYKPVKETIIYFPIDPSVTFLKSKTHLAAEEKKDQYRIDWTVSSQLDKNAFLRQDVGLLFLNGKLIGIQKDWEQNKQSLNQEQAFTLSNDGVLEGISFHYAELHPTQETYRSAQSLSDALLYVMDSSGTDFHAFSRPFTVEEVKFKNRTDSMVQKLQEQTLKKAADSFSLNLQHYKVLPLTKLKNQEAVFFSGLTESKRAETIGQLWEGLYKNYVINIKKENGTVLNPINSTVPLLLLNKNLKELLVVTLAEDGSPILLAQLL